MVSVLIQKQNKSANIKISLVPSDTNKFTDYYMNSRIFNFFWECKPRKKGDINESASRAVDI